MASNDELTEHVKWQDRSCSRGVDRVTFRLFPTDHLELVFDRGAKPDDTEGFVFDDDAGLLRRWVATDPGRAHPRRPGRRRRREAAIVALVNRWVAVP